MLQSGGVAVQRVICLLLSVLVSAAVWSEEPPIQASMVIVGSITVNPDGGVQSYTVRDLDKLPPAARQIIQSTVPRWRFVPIMAGGKAVAAQASMSLRIIADMIDKYHATIHIAGAAFGCDAQPESALPSACPAGSTLTYSRAEPPRYPFGAARAEVGGEVFLVLQIGRDGHVMRAAARRINLYTITRDPELYRKILADASLNAALKWEFHVPTSGQNAGKDQWIVQVPVNYGLDWLPSRFGSHRPRIQYGKWNAYIPGPVQNIPWAHDGDGPKESADAIPDSGAPFVRDTRFVLKTPLAGGSVGQS